MSESVRFNILTEDEIKEIHAVTLEILEKTGVWVSSDKGLRLLVDAGCAASGDTACIMSSYNRRFSLKLYK